jgi:hypothetical protein
MYNCRLGGDTSAIFGRLLLISPEPHQPAVCIGDSPLTRARTDWQQDKKNQQLE